MEDREGEKGERARKRARKGGGHHTLEYGLGSKSGYYGRIRFLKMLDFELGFAKGKSGLRSGYI